MCLIKVSNLNKSYVIDGNKKNKILENLNFSLEEGDFTIIEGNSGIGKSTFINILLGFLKKDSGNIHLLGKSIDEYDHGELSHILLTKIGYAPQEVALLKSLNVMENITAPNILLGENINFPIEKYAKILKVEGILNQKVSTLSGGETKKVQILRAMANKPKILILDEPTSSLDKDSVKDLINMLVEINKSTTLLCITHDDRLKEIGEKRLILEDYRLKKI